MPTLDPKKRKKPKPCAPTLPIWQAIKSQRFSFLIAKKLKQLFVERRKFFEDDAGRMWEQHLCDQRQETGSLNLSKEER